MIVNKQLMMRLGELLMRYNGFVNMVLGDQEFMYEFKDGYFAEDGLRAKYRLANPKEDDLFGGNFSPIEGRFPFREHETGVFYSWFITELRFVF